MGLAEDNQQLRKLSRAVMRGELSRSEYLQERRRLVDSYTGDAGAADDQDLTDPGGAPALPGDVTTPAMPARSMDTTAPSMASSAISSGKAEDASADHAWVGLVAVLLVLGVVAGLLAWLL